jgi:hypothetical protein
MSIEFNSDVYVITKILYKTAAKYWNELKVGDKIQFTIPLHNTTGCRGLYALNVEVQFLTIYPHSHPANPRWKNTQNRFLGNVSNFQLEKVK